MSAIGRMNPEPLNMISAKTSVASEDLLLFGA
jgi:hypothetical protein